MDWNQKPYHSLDYELKRRFGRKIYKLSLDGGMTCPNRDGTLGNRGCIFCSSGGSGDFAAQSCPDVWEQIEAAKARVRRKMPPESSAMAPPSPSYIAYFQSFTNTYGDADRLRALYQAAMVPEDVVILSIATRPDCLGPDILGLLEELNRIKPVWVELGLQTIHERTAAFIRRGYTFPVFEQAVRDLRAAGLDVIVHVILFLPGETQEDMYQTIRQLNRMDIQGIKLQLLHILKGTDLADFYESHPFFIPCMEDYFRVLGGCLGMLRPDIVIHRLTGDGPKELLIAPLWTGNKRYVLNQFHAYLKRQHIWQGRSYIHV